MFFFFHNSLMSNVLQDIFKDYYEENTSDYDRMIQTEENTMSKRSDEIRDKYIKNPPEGMTADDIRHMSEDDLLDMDYFLNEDDDFGEDFPGAEGFYIF